MKRLIILLLPLLLGSFLTYGAPQDIRFSHIGLKQGLSHSTVNGIAQDRRGYLWVATPDGLNRYDGFRFSIFYPDSLDNNIKNVAADDDGHIWAITAKVLSEYVPDRNALSSYNAPADTEFTALLPLNSDTIAVGTDKGLYYFDKQKKKFTHVGSGLASPVTALTVFNGRLITATADGALMAYSGEKGEILSSPLGTGINVMLPDKGALLVGTEGSGLFLYNEAAGSLTRIAENVGDRYVRSLISDSLGRLWIGTFTGLYVLDPERRMVVFHDDATGADGALSHSSVRRMTADNQGGIWLGTYYGGLNYFNPQFSQFITLQKNDKSPYSISGNIVGPLAENKNGDIWIGTNNGGLNVYSPSSGIFRKISNKEGLGSDDVKAIYIDNHSRKAYVGTHIGGLTEISLDTYKVIGRKDVASSVYAIVPALETGYLWLATLDGLKYFDTATGKAYDVDAKDIPAQTTSLMRDSKRRLWVSGEGGLTVYKEDGDRLTPLSDLPSMKVFVNATYQSRNSDIFWISTHNGLYRFEEKTGSIHRYDTADGLPGDIIFATVEDPNSNIWISTNRGLASLNPSSGKVITYVSRNGLGNTQFSERSALYAGNGRLYFGGIDGLTYFNPTILETNSFPPLPIIEKLTIPEDSDSKGSGNMKHVLSMDQDYVTIDSHNRNFTIDFTACDFISEGNNTFRYMLDGLDNQWITPPPGVRSVSYSNLPPGTYVFRLQAANNDGVWNETDASLKIRILPPWYRTWWAIALFSLTGILMVSAAITYLLRRKIREKQRKTRQEVTEMKVRFFVNLSHELRTPLTLMMLPVNDLMASNPDPATMQKLATIRNNTLRIKHIVDQLLDYRRAELGMLKLNVAELDLNSTMTEILTPYRDLALKKRINFKFDSTVNDTPLLVDINYIELIVNNLVSNAFKYTPAGGDITVCLSVAGQTLRLAVSDTGCGIPADKLDSIFTRFYQIDDSIAGYGIGLSLVKRLVELHHGQIAVESTVGKGSVFIVSIPIDRKAYSKSELSVHESNDDRKALPKEDLTLLLSMDEESEILPANPDSDRKTVLLVDDNAEILKYISSILSAEFRVLTAADGAKAIETLGSENVDLVVSDVMMPDVDGVQLCRTVKRNLRTSHIPFILLSAKADIADRLDAFKVGADDYMPKPFNMEELLAKVKNQIRTRENIIRHYSQENVQIEPAQVAQNPLDEEFLKKAVKILNDHLDDSQFTTDEFARHMCMSRSNLHLKMKALTGETTNDFIRRTRMRKAIELLKTRRYTVAEVSAMVGYNTPSYFATSFKNFYGYSPSSIINQS